MNTFVNSAFAGSAMGASNQKAPPQEVLERAALLAKSVSTSEQASDAFEEVSVLLPQFAPSAELYTSCGLLLEKMRQKTGMLESWIDIHELFPREPLPFRMMLRWYRRMSDSQGGLRRIGKAKADWAGDPKMAELLILGHDELQSFKELDSEIIDLLEQYPKNDRLRFLYLKSLNGQGRIGKAKSVLSEMSDFSRLGPSALDLIQEIAAADIPGLDSVGDVEASVVGLLCRQYFDRSCEVSKGAGSGRIVFFTGQLGAGGAERQMTRIAAGMQFDYEQSETPKNQQEIGQPPVVCVKDARSSQKKDFFLPVLRAANVETHILVNREVPEPETLAISPQQYALFERLPADVRKAVLQLVEVYRDADARVAYLWQDGAILSGALAGLIAGVPRIVASFRGLPPNIRTELNRPEYEPLYKALYMIPGVSFTANSQAAATAYEEWLGFEPGTVEVIHNAVPPISDEGSAADLTRWNEILEASAEVTKTVIGVFRFDHNKRPQFWIEAAIDYSRKHEDTRFVIVGQGDEYASCQAMIEEAGVGNRVFLVGHSEHVGFWMHRADMLMHLAKFEGLPNVVIEAQLSGLPVLATPAGGTSDVIAHKTTGYVLESAEDPDPEEIAAQLETVLEEDDLRIRWGQAAQEIASQRFDLSKILDATFEHFEKCPIEK